jgi:TonB family protein
MTSSIFSCPNCSNSLSAGTRFCNHCGESVAQTTASNIASIQRLSEQPTFKESIKEGRIADQDHSLMSQLLPGAPVSESGSIDCSVKGQFGYGSHSPTAGAAGALMLLAGFFLRFLRLGFILAFFCFFVWTGLSVKPKHHPTTESSDEQIQQEDSSQEGSRYHKERSRGENGREEVKNGEMTIGELNNKVSVEDQKYIRSVEEKIKEHWHPIKSSVPKSTKLRFKIVPDGRVSYVEIVKSSGSKEVDHEAYRTLEESAPFARPPKGSPDGVYIEFEFDYKVHSSRGH